MLRGEVDPYIDKFGTYEDMYSANIDEWLCNLYFQTLLLPKYQAGEVEFEVELDYTGNHIE